MKKNAKCTSLLLFIVFFVLFAGNFCLDLQNPIPMHYAGDGSAFSPPTKMLTTASELEVILGQSDSGSYLRGGRSVLNVGLKNTLQLGYGLWPPGMFLAYALLFTINDNIPPALFWFCVSGLLWALVFTLFVKVCGTYGRCYSVIAFGLGTGCLLFPTFRQTTLWDMIMLSEAIAIPLMFAGIFSYALLLRRKSRAMTYIIPGLMFMLAIMFRANTLPPILFVLCALGIWSWLAYKTKKISKAFYKRCVTGVATCSLVILSVLFPYMWWNHGLTQADYMWSQVWRSDVMLQELGADWLVDAGVNAAFHLEPEKAKTLYEADSQLRKKSGNTEGIKYETYKKEALITFINHPLQLVLFKSPVFFKLFFKYPDTIVLSALFVLALALCFTQNKILFSGIVAIGVAMGMGIVGPSFLWHFEYRYLLPLVLEIMFFVVFEFTMFLGCLVQRISLKTH